MSADFDLTGLSWRLAHHLFRFDAPVGLASYLLVPIGAWLAYRQETARSCRVRSAGAFARYCIPLDVVTSRSCRLDLVYVGVKHFLNTWLLAPILVSSAFVANLVHGALDGTLGPRPEAVPGMFVLFAVIAFCVVVQDFTQFLIHFGHHKIKMLWDVHRVHHSAEILTFGLSVKRTHMIEEAINLILTSLVLGLTIGVLSYALGIAVWRSEMMGVDSWFLLNLFSFWHLRHSPHEPFLRMARERPSESGPAPAASQPGARALGQELRTALFFLGQAVRLFPAQRRSGQLPPRPPAGQPRRV